MQSALTHFNVDPGVRDKHDGEAKQRYGEHGVLLLIGRVPHDVAVVEAQTHQLILHESGEEIGKSEHGGDDPEYCDDEIGARPTHQGRVMQWSYDRYVVVSGHADEIQQRHVETGRVESLDDDERAPGEDAFVVRPDPRGVDDFVDDVHRDAEPDENVGQSETRQQPEVRREPLTRVSDGDQRQQVEEDGRDTERQGNHLVRVAQQQSQSTDVVTGRVVGRVVGVLQEVVRRVIVASLGRRLSLFRLARRVPGAHASAHPRGHLPTAVSS